MVEKKSKALLLLVLLLAFSVRMFGASWDSNYHLHPDERAIIMASEGIELPRNTSEFLSKTSRLNPHFFAYGSLPMYLLKGTGSLLNKLSTEKIYANYDGLLRVGRMLSTLLEVGTALLIFLLVLEYTNKSTGVLAAFLYSFSVLAIQTSHFFVVDIPLTFLTTLTLLRLVKFVKNPSSKNTILLAISFGLALATKISMILLVGPIMLTFLYTAFKDKSLVNFLKYSLITGILTLITFITVMPYAVIDSELFIGQVREQLQMNSNPYIFPFTLQYVGTPSYWYYIKNILLWGTGPTYGIIILISAIWVTYTLIANLKHNFKKNTSLLIIALFFWIYFALLGKSAVKFMRYMLPIYPLFAIFSAIFLSTIISSFKRNLNSTILFTFNFSLLTLLLVWPFSFLTIYTRPNTRVTATEWIHQNISAGKTISVEHWDDMLPIYFGEYFKMQELPLYDNDDESKWDLIATRLSESNYLVIASNRLYVPLIKLGNCDGKYKRCYPLTSQYYKTLFSEELGFKQVALFTNYPTIPYLNKQIIDDSADESFTVYDHPKILIYQNTQYYPPGKLLDIITNGNDKLFLPLL